MQDLALIIALLIIFRFFLEVFSYILVAAGVSSGLTRYMSVRSGQIPSHAIRNFLLRNVFKIHMEPKTIVYMGYELRHPRRIKIGKGSIIGNDAKLDGRFGIEIGNNVNFSTGVWIWTQQHDPQDPDFGTKEGKVQIGDRAWISNRVTILPGVTIGEGAVVAANAVVTKDLEPYGIYGGIPARKIGERRTDIKYVLNGKGAPFF